MAWGCALQRQHESAHWPLRVDNYRWIRSVAGQSRKWWKLRSSEDFWILRNLLYLCYFPLNTTPCCLKPCPLQPTEATVHITPDLLPVLIELFWNINIQTQRYTLPTGWQGQALCDFIMQIKQLTPNSYTTALSVNVGDVKEQLRRITDRMCQMKKKKFQNLFK